MQNRHCAYMDAEKRKEGTDSFNKLILIDYIPIFRIEKKNIIYEEIYLHELDFQLKWILKRNTNRKESKSFSSYQR